MSKSKTGTKTAKTVKSSKKEVSALYPVSKLTKNSSKNLWVTFVAGKPSKGLVFSSVLSRDTVRNTAAKKLGTQMSDIRSRRVASYRRFVA